MVKLVSEDTNQSVGLGFRNIVYGLWGHNPWVGEL